jgi:hypothetical protein
MALMSRLDILRIRFGRISIFARFSVSSTTLGFTLITPKRKKGGKEASFSR